MIPEQVHEHGALLAHAAAIDYIARCFGMRVAACGAAVVPVKPGTC